MFIIDASTVLLPNISIIMHIIFLKQILKIIFLKYHFFKKILSLIIKSWHLLTNGPKA